MRYYTIAMKRRSIDPEADDLDALAGLARALASLRTADEVTAFLEDLCTPAERQAMADRWRVIPLLLNGMTYRDIHDRTGVSVTTVGRVARCLELGAGGYRTAARRLRLPGAGSHH
jgi:TrpR-related protein YerC/YecD